MPSKHAGIWGARQRGVAVLAKKAVPMKLVAIPEPYRQALWSTSRVVHVHIALADGRLVLNILSIYAPQKGGRENTVFWTRLAEYMARLGTVLVLLAGEYNVPLDDQEGMPPQVLTEVLAGRWIDVDLHLARAERRPTVARFHNGSSATAPMRIDGVMADLRLASTVQAVTVIEDVGLPGHTPICLSLRVGMTQ